MQRHISTLPLPSSYITKLNKHGIEFLNDFNNLKPTELIKGLLQKQNKMLQFFE